MGRVIVVSDAVHYRRQARTSVDPSMDVLEIGCSTGITTRELSLRARRVFAVDVSAQMLARTAAATAGHASVALARIDGRDIAGLLDFVADVHAVFMDLGGNGPVEAAVSTMRQCLSAYKPRLLVVRNEQLADLAGLIVEAIPPADAVDRVLEHPYSTLDILNDLLALSGSTQVPHRVIAAHRLSKWDAPQARARLDVMTADPSPRVRRIACSALRTTHGPKSACPGGVTEFR